MSAAEASFLEVDGEKFAIVGVYDLNPDYRRQPKTEHFCCLCQRDIKTPPAETQYLHFVDGGAVVLSAADYDRWLAVTGELPGGQDPGDVGCFPVGPDCARRLPAGFVHEPKGAA